MQWNIPTLLTWLRIVMIPLFVGVFYLPEAQMSGPMRDLTATVIFMLAAVTDWFDGYLARKWNQTSAFGAFLDPVADKLMVAAALIVLVEFDRVGAVIALIIIGREITISALREWMAGIGQGKGVAVAMIGKLKTVAQMMAIPFLLYYRPIGSIDVKLIGTLLIYVAAILTLWSMSYYLRAAWPQMRGK
jgi:CDP-diacylglycerol--glycerol-3-phosphate 3-phosphatidyltransferase